MKFKEKPKMGKPKAKPPSALNPKRAARQMKEKYLRELDQRPEGPETETGYATGQVEDAGRWAADSLTDAATGRRPDQRWRNYIKDRAHAGKQAPLGPDAAPDGEGAIPATERPANAPKERQAVEGRARGERAASGKVANAPKERSAARDRKSVV